MPLRRAENGPTEQKQKHGLSGGDGTKVVLPFYPLLINRVEILAVAGKPPGLHYAALARLVLVNGNGVMGLDGLR